jgi:hypothetical protein
MAEIDQTIAAQGRPIQSQAPDIVGTIDSLAKLSYYADLGRQAEANAGLINQQTLAAQAGFAANQEQYSRLKQGANPEDVAAPLAVFNGQGAKVGLSISMYPSCRTAQSRAAWGSMSHVQSRPFGRSTTASPVITLRKALTS